MVSAGVAAFFNFDPRFESKEECVKAVYRAMQAVERHPDFSSSS
jgi:hypothetical protein